MSFREKEALDNLMSKKEADGRYDLIFTEERLDGSRKIAEMAQ